MPTILVTNGRFQEKPSLISVDVKGKVDIGIDLGGEVGTEIQLADAVAAQTLANLLPADHLAFHSDETGYVYDETGKAVDPKLWLLPSRKQYTVVEQ